MNKNNMNCIKSILIIFFLACWVSITLKAQICFVRKTDLSGLDFNTQMPSLEQAACSLKNTFPEPFKGEFKVFEASFYLHNPAQKNAAENLWNLLKQEVSTESPYYLLILREIVPNEIISRFRVDIKFPTTGQFDCVTPAKVISLRHQVETTINRKFVESNKVPYFFPNAEIEGMKVLQNEISRFVDCCLCCQGNSVVLNTTINPCSQCKFSGDGMAGYLKSLGFAEYADAVVMVSSHAYSQPLESQYNINVQIRGATIPLTDELSTFLASAQSVGAAKARVRVFDSANCNEFENFIPLSHSGIYTEDIVVIDIDGKKRIFYKITEDISASSVAAKNGNVKENEAVLPILGVWLLKRAAMAAVNIGTHLLTETALEYYFGEHADFWEAWDAVDLDWWEVIEAGVEGIVGANNLKVQAFMGACRQTIDYLTETPYDQLDPWQIGASVVSGAVTGVLNFYIDVGTEKFQGLLNKYGPNIAVRSFRNLGLTEMFFKFKSFRRTYINIVWLKAGEFDRGWLIEEALRFSTYKGWTAIGTANGPADYLANGWASQIKSIAKADPDKDWANIRSHVNKGCDKLLECMTTPAYAHYNVANLRLDIVIPSSEMVHYNTLLQEVRTHIQNRYANVPAIQQMLVNQKVIIGTFLD